MTHSPDTVTVGHRHPHVTPDTGTPPMSPRGVRRSKAAEVQAVSTVDGAAADSCCVSRVRIARRRDAPAGGAPAGDCLVTCVVSGAHGIAPATAEAGLAQPGRRWRQQRQQPRALTATHAIRIIRVH